jgi:hypothetical protein
MGGVKVGDVRAVFKGGRRASGGAVGCTSAARGATSAEEGAARDGVAVGGVAVGGGAVNGSAVNGAAPQALGADAAQHQRCRRGRLE